MSGKLDQSLDEILSTQRKTVGNRRRSARRSTGRPATTAPAGGIHKATKTARNAAKSAPARGSGKIGESKIMVSNLPKDVSEGQIKEYFQQAVGQVKRVEISYGPGGISRGLAHVIFHHADGASKAFGSLNGLLIDNRPVKVEVVVSSADQIPQPKTLSQRLSQPKPQPRSAAAVKGATGAKAGTAGKPVKKGAASRRGGRSARPSKKTAQELDSEMADYFVGTSATNETAATGGAPAATNGDAAMDDEVL